MMKKKTKQKKGAVAVQALPAVAVSVKDSPSGRILKQMLAQARADNQTAEVARIATLSRPEDDRAMTDKDRRELAAVEIDLDNAVKAKRGVRRARAKVAAVRREISSRIDGRLEERGVQTSVAGRLKLEADRAAVGEGLEAEGAAVRIKGRDGLTSLFKGGTIKRSPWVAGLAFRACHEAKAAGLRTARYDAVSHGGSDKSGMQAALHQAYMSARLKQFERAIMRRDPTGRALAVVVAVAGEGRTIRSLGDGGAVKVANTKALKLGLEGVLDALPVAPRSKSLANRGPLSS